jgi:hypothetical protein
VAVGGAGAAASDAGGRAPAQRDAGKALGLAIPDDKLFALADGMIE